MRGSTRLERRSEAEIPASVPAVSVPGVGIVSFSTNIAAQTLSSAEAEMSPSQVQDGRISVSENVPMHSALDESPSDSSSLHNSNVDIDTLNVSELLLRLKAERARADAAAKTASDEKARADAAAKTASDEKARADAAAKTASDEKARARGSFWLMMPSLLLSRQKQELSSKYESTVVSGPPDTVFGRFLPEREWLKEFEGVPLDKETLRRSPPKILHGLWGETIKDGCAQLAHLIPFSWDCCIEWLCLFLPFVCAALMRTKLEDDEKTILGLCMLMGLKVRADRYDLSGLLHSCLNFIPLRGQARIFDTDPAVMFIPLLSPSAILFWKGEPYRCLIICRSFHEVMTAGFQYSSVHSDTGESLVDADLFCELETDDTTVLEAFESFKTLLLMVVPFLASQKLKAVTSLKLVLCEIFRNFLAQVSASGTPDVPCPCIIGIRKSVVMCLKFQSREAREPRFPSFGSGTSDRRPDQHEDPVLPHPFLLFLRSLNAWFNYLHLSGIWQEWNQYLATQPKKAIGKSRKRKLVNTDPLVILPSCRDMDIDSCRCVQCKAADVCENAELYSTIPDEVWQAAMAMMNPASGSPITDEEAQRILDLRRFIPDEVVSSDDEGGARAPGDEGKVLCEDSAQDSAAETDAVFSTRTTRTGLPPI